MLLSEPRQCIREFTVRSIARLKRRLKLLGITQEAVAREARVDRTMVNHVLAGRANSRFVRDAAERLIGQVNGRRVG